MRRRSARTAILIVFLLLVALADAAVQRSRADGDRLQKKIDDIAANGAAARTKPKTTPVSESELNSYLAFNLRNDVPRGLAEPEIVMSGDGSLAGRVLVDIDEFNRSRGPQSVLDPLSYLSGQVPVTARGVLRTHEGRGRFYLSSAELQGVPLPRSVVQELVRYFSRTADNPRGIDMDEPFDLPAKIRRIEVGRGEAVVAQ
ncbi:MAG TPA: hypothetical protein VHL99_02755 [Candidatus Binatia bacterium]|jgi:hypothetical protein|nr:hypothetical protein [Candidatus Binatia bacterium]